MTTPPAPQLGLPLAIGIFVGGQGVRMGGVAKANLIVEGRTVLERTLECCSAAVRSLSGGAAAPRIWLVGESSRYVASGVSRIADDPAGVGPMGGLRAFLRTLAPGSAGLAIAGDLPFVTEQLIVRLASEATGAAAFAPRDAEGRWQPLFARYLPAPLLPEIDAALFSGKTSLQHLFARLEQRALTLELSAAEQLCLRDWDRPCDMIAGCPESPG